MVHLLLLLPMTIKDTLPLLLLLRQTARNDDLVLLSWYRVVARRSRLRRLTACI